MLQISKCFLFYEYMYLVLKSVVYTHCITLYYVRAFPCEYVLYAIHFPAFPFVLFSPPPLPLVSFVLLDSFASNFVS